MGESTFDPYVIAKHFWALYFASTEAFDRRLPGMPSQREPDCWMVTEPEGRAQSARFARELDVRTRGWLSYLEIDRETSDAARERVLGMRFVEQQALAERIQNYRERLPYRTAICGDRRAETRFATGVH